MPHGPEAIRLIRIALALDPAGADDLLLYAVAGVAVNVLDEVYDRDEGIALLVADQRHDLERRDAARLLDLAVEALTANPQE